VVDVYEILIREHEKMLLGFVLGIVRDPHLAEDVTQEAFVLAYRKLDSLRDKARFGSWIRRIAYNAAMMALRKRRRELPTDPMILAGMEDVFSAIDEQSDETWEDKARHVERCFDSLPQAQQECCRLFYFKNRKAREIAERLQTKLATILKRLERARSALRRCIERRLGLEEIR